MAARFVFSDHEGLTLEDGRKKERIIIIIIISIKKNGEKEKKSGRKERRRRRRRWRNRSVTSIWSLCVEESLIIRRVGDRVYVRYVALDTKPTTERKKTRRWLSQIWSRWPPSAFRKGCLTHRRPSSRAILTSFRARLPPTDGFRVLFL